jgi:hypothetical protein
MKKEIELKAISLYYTDKEYKSIRNKLQRLKYPRNKLGGIVTYTYAYILCEEEDYKKLYETLSTKKVRIRGELAKTKYIIHSKDVEKKIVTNKKVDIIVDNLKEMINS